MNVQIKGMMLCFSSNGDFASLHYMVSFILNTSFGTFLDKAWSVLYVDYGRLWSPFLESKNTLYTTPVHIASIEELFMQVLEMCRFFMVDVVAGLSATLYKTYIVR